MTEEWQKIYINNNALREDPEQFTGYLRESVLLCGVKEIIIFFCFSYVQCDEYEKAIDLKAILFLPHWPAQNDQDESRAKA